MNDDGAPTGLGAPAEVVGADPARLDLADSQDDSPGDRSARPSGKLLSTRGNLETGPRRHSNPCTSPHTPSKSEAVVHHHVSLLERGGVEEETCVRPSMASESRKSGQGSTVKQHDPGLNVFASDTARVAADLDRLGSWDVNTEAVSSDAAQESPLPRPQDSPLSSRSRSPLPRPQGPASHSGNDDTPPAECEAEAACEDGADLPADPAALVRTAATIAEEEKGTNIAESLEAEGEQRLLMDHPVLGDPLAEQTSTSKGMVASGTDGTIAGAHATVAPAERGEGHGEIDQGPSWDAAGRSGATDEDDHSKVVYGEALAQATWMSPSVKFLTATQGVNADEKISFEQVCYLFIRNICW